MIRTLILATIIGFGFSGTASAAGWGAVAKGGCDGLTGKRKYSAKLWTGIGEGKASTVCPKTKLNHSKSGINRVPDSCENHIANVSYGVWKQTDTTCPGGVAGPVLPRPDPGIDPEVIKDRFRPKVIAETIKVGVQQIHLKWLNFKFEDPGVKKVVEQMVRAWNEFTDDNEIIAFMEYAHEFNAALISDSPEAIAVRKAFAGRDVKAGMTNLAKMPEFQKMSEETKKSAFINSFSYIAIEADASKVIGANVDWTVIVGWMEEQESLGVMTGLGPGISIGPSYGVDAAIANVGVWTDTLDNVQGNTHGFTFAGPVTPGFGVTASVHFDYPKNCKAWYNGDRPVIDKEDKDPILRGFTIGGQTPSSGEIEYMRSHFAMPHYGLVLDPSHENFYELVPLKDRPPTTIQPCWFGD